MIVKNSVIIGPANRSADQTRRGLSWLTVTEQRNNRCSQSGNQRQKFLLFTHSRTVSIFSPEKMMFS